MDAFPIFVISVIAALVGLYFLPALIVRNKQHARAIQGLNLYLGWTGIGWIAALLWAIMSPKLCHQSKEVVAAPKNCPLCETEKHMGQKAEMLYGHLVCRKCHVAFANRRQLAFVIDAILGGNWCCACGVRRWSCFGDGWSVRFPVGGSNSRITVDVIAGVPPKRRIQGTLAW